MKRAALYARFSTDKQDQHSIDRQLASCTEACARQDFIIAATFEDRALSGASTLTRPGWQRLMAAAVQRQFDIVMIEDVDRAFRDEADYHAGRKRLEFIEVALHTPAGFVTRIEGTIKALQGAMTLAHLKERVHGGLKLVVKEGRHVAAPPFGYQLLKGEGVKPGTLRIDETEAAIVRRIFKDYVAGWTPRDLAKVLNAERVPGPRKGIWHASTIHGSRKRQSGILQNTLYDGRFTWNRQRFTKNPDTGTRVSRLNPMASWVEQAAPDLRIVDPETFARAQSEKKRRGGSHASPAVKPRHLLSGLIKCGHCGSSYTVAGSDKVGKFMRCSRMRETGTCDNTTLIRMDRLEARVIEAMEKQLAAPDVVAAYVRAHHRMAKEHLGQASQVKRQLQKELAGVEAECRNIVDAIAKSKAARSLAERLDQLEERRLALEARLEAVQAPPVAFHPQAAENYRRKVADLKALLAKAEPAFRQEGMARLRELVEKIVIHPTGRRRPPDVEIHGQIAALLQASTGVPALPQATVGAMVAGVGFTLHHSLPLVIKLPL